MNAGVHLQLVINLQVLQIYCSIRVPLLSLRFETDGETPLASLAWGAKRLRLVVRRSPHMPRGTLVWAFGIFELSFWLWASGLQTVPSFTLVFGDGHFSFQLRKSEQGPAAAVAVATGRGSQAAGDHRATK